MRKKSARGLMMGIALGWYLMVPPPKMRPEEITPLHMWHVLDSYDTAAQCHEDLRSYKELIKKDPAYFEKNSGRGMAQLAQEALDEAECISTDDPRLRQ